MSKCRLQRFSVAAVIVCALAAAATAEPSPPATTAADRRESVSVAPRPGAIEILLDRIAAALEEQLELERLDLIARRVESGERRLDELEGSRAQARSYLLSLRERLATADRVLAGARERVETSWPPGSRAEAVRLRDEAETTREQIDAEIASQEESLAAIDARAARVRQEITAWNRLLEGQLEAPIPAAEEPVEGPEASSAVP
jgi:chromosome segregation ATPase